MADGERTYCSGCQTMQKAHKRCNVCREKNRRHRGRNKDNGVEGEQVYREHSRDVIDEGEQE